MNQKRFKLITTATFRTGKKAMTEPQDDLQILPALALALVDRPRATLQELAKAVGVSKATLYRFCHTRNQLIKRLMGHSTAVFNQVLQASGLEDGPPLDALKRLIAHNLEHRELTVFLIYYWWSDDSADFTSEANWQDTLDTFFLRGQQQGIFRIDIPAPALTELWGSILVGLVDAERRGRVARVGLATLVETAFLEGSLAKN